MIEQSELISSFAVNLTFLLSLCLVELGNISAVDIAEEVKSFFWYFLVKEHAGHAYNCVPKVIIVGLVEIPYQTIGRIRARIAEEIVSIVIFDFALYELLVLP